MRKRLNKIGEKFDLSSVIIFTGMMLGTIWFIDYVINIIC